METQPPDGWTALGPLDTLVYVLVSLVTLIGVWLAVDPWYDAPGTEFLYLAALVVLAPLATVLLGYTDRSFVAAVIVMSLPGSGLLFGWFLRELTIRGIESGVAAALTAAGVTLPIGGVLYVLGVGLRRDGTLSRRKRGLAVRVLAVTLLGVLLYVAVQEFGVLNVLNDQ